MDVKHHIIYNGKNPKQSHWMQSMRDDTLVRRLRDLGAVIFGVTIMTEGGVTPLGYNSHFQGNHFHTYLMHGIQYYILLF